MHSKKNKNKKQSVKASAFDALKSSDESEADPATPTTATPTQTPPPSCFGDVSAEPIPADGDAPDAEWAVAPPRRKPRPVRTVAPSSEGQRAVEQLRKDECDDEEADTEWFHAKGQRHAHSKTQ